MRALTVGLMAGAVAVALSGCVPPSIEHDHDRYTGARTMRVMRLSVGNGLLLSASRTEGTGGRPSGSVLLALSSSQRDWRYLRYHALALLVDGRSFELQTEHDGDVLSGGYVSEVVYTRLPIAAEIALATAMSIEGRVGLTEFALTPDQVALVREVARGPRTASPAAAPPSVADAPRTGNVRPLMR